MPTINPGAPNSSSPRLIFIFDQLRSRSHLFHRFLSTHPALTPLWHPFLKAAYFGPERHSLRAQNSPARQEEVQREMLPRYAGETYASCARELEAAVERAGRDGRILLANEHGVNVLKQDFMFHIARGEAYTVPANPTMISDGLYDSLVPVILIRHPVFQLPSSYTAALRTVAMRPGDEDFSNSTTLAFSRFLYDDFVAKGREPIIVDGDDVVWRTQEVKEGVCARLGLEAQEVRETWDPVELGQYAVEEPVIRGYLAEVLASERIKREGQEVSGVSIPVLASKNLRSLCVAGSGDADKSLSSDA